jgi:hypothetical protein
LFRHFLPKQQNKQNVQGAQQQAYTSETNAASQSVIEEQISDTVIIVLKIDTFP